MNRNLFIRLTFAVHRVADTFSDEELKQEIKEAANTILADLILFVEKEGVSKEKKYGVLPQIMRQVDVLFVYLDRAKREGWVNPESFSVLEVEYGRIKDFLQVFESIQLEESKREEKPIEKAKVSSPKVEKEPIRSGTLQPGKKKQVSDKQTEKADLPERQRKILEFLKRKDTAQVWELQKVLPQVTKRTLRRDLDSLLQLDLVARKGEWNSVVYELKEKNAVA